MELQWKRRTIFLYAFLLCNLNEHSLLLPKQHSSNLIPLVVPAGFYREGGALAQRVSVGSKNGRMVAIYLKQGILHFFNHSTMDDDPWVTHKARDFHNGSLGAFCDVSVASDGTVYGIRANNRAIYRYYWPRSEMPIDTPAIEQKKARLYAGRWVPVTPIKKDTRHAFEHVSVGNATEVWALDKRGVLYRREGATWKCKGAKRKWRWVAVGYDGTVVAIDASHNLYTYVDGTWKHFENSPKLVSVAVASKKSMIGLGYKDGLSLGTLWEYEKNSWMQLHAQDGRSCMGFKDITINPAGTVFIIDYKGRLYANGEEGIPVTLKAMHHTHIS